MFKHIAYFPYWIGLVMSETVLYLEPPNCTFNYTLKEHEVLYLDSSHPSHSENQDGSCSVIIQASNRSKYLNYYFEHGPNITDCSAELLFQDRQKINSKFPVPHYTCNNLHPYQQAHADNWTGQVLVRRRYVTMRKDFFFRIKVVQVEPWTDHDDNGLGFYVDRSAREPSVPFVLYIILGLDFLLPTVIFLVNEFSGRIAEDNTKREDSPNPAHPLSMMNPAFPGTSDASPVIRHPKNAAVGIERQSAFDTSSRVGPRSSAVEEFEGLFPFYKQPSDLNNSSGNLKQRGSKITHKAVKSDSSDVAHKTTVNDADVDVGSNDMDEQVDSSPEKTKVGQSSFKSSAKKSHQQLRFSD